MMAALCGSRIALTHGPMGRKNLNLGVVLTGVPAIRKSTSLKMVQKFAEGLPISYGPTDTAGQRQGIMSSMLPRWQKDSQDATINLDIDALDELANLDTDSVAAVLPDPTRSRSSEIYFVASELGRLLSGQGRDLLDFFADGLDGEPIYYRIKNTEIRIPKPLINLLGATTPESLGNILPSRAAGHGVLSRIIFVHATHVAQSVAVPEKWNDGQLKMREGLQEVISDMLNQDNAEIDFTEAATQTYRDLYSYMPQATDIRLAAYGGRRADHLTKVACLLAILRGTAPIRVQASDVRLSHAILTLTEMEMDRAFYGLDMGLNSRLLCAISDIIQASPRGEVQLSQIQQQASHLANRATISEMVASFQDQGKLQLVAGSVYALNTEMKTLGQKEILTCFTRSESFEEDEYIPHRHLALVQTQKGDAG